MTTRTPRAGSAARSLLALLLIAGLAGGGYLYWVWRGGNGRGVRFRTEKVTKGRIASLINASGTVVPEEVVDVGAQVAGKIVDFGKDIKGDTVDYRSRVKKNAPLAFIDKALFEPEVGIAKADLALCEAEVKRSAADLDATQARLTQATRDLERAKRLASSSTIAASEVDNLQQLYLTTRAAVPAAEATLEKARQTVKKARETLDKAETNLRYTTILSPVDGVIIDRRVNIGQTVVSSLNAPSLFLIAKDLKKMQVWATVNEADIGRIYPGQAAAFKVDAFPDRVFVGTVYQVRLNATMTQNVVTYTVVVSTDNPDEKLLPYLTANLQFKVAARDNVLKVPNAALRYRPSPDRVVPEHADEYARSRQEKRAASTEMMPGNDPPDTSGTVWVERDGLVKPVAVKTGLTDGNSTEVEPVKEGEIQEGDAIVTAESGGGAGPAGGNPFAVKMFSGKKKE